MTVPEITVDDVAATQETAATILIDVRDPEEYAAGHIPGARLVPLPQIADHLPELRDTRELQVVCQSGNRSARAVAYLTEQGIPAVSVAGGTRAWIASGRAVSTEPPLHPEFPTSREKRWWLYPARPPGSAPLARGAAWPISS